MYITNTPKPNRGVDSVARSQIYCRDVPKAYSRAREKIKRINARNSSSLDSQSNLRDLTI